MTATDAAPAGLRERKRQATRRAIQIATIQLVQERGLDGVTVDEIARVADVSPRTFFNYFSSKDAAIVGDKPLLPGDAEIERFIAADGAMIDDLAELLASAAGTNTQDLELVQLRRELVKSTPQLMAMRMASMRHFEEDLVAIVARRLRRQHPARDEAELLDEARLVTYVTVGGMRAAWVRWADGHHGAALSELVRAALGEAGRLLGTTSGP